MTDQLQFAQRDDGLWFSKTLEGGAFYRIRMFYPGLPKSDYELMFIERKADGWAPRGWRLRYESVSKHRSLERAIEQANRHHRKRYAGRGAP